MTSKIAAASAALLAAGALAGSAAAQTPATTPTPAPAAPAAPPCSTPEYRQLDIWVGDWDSEFDLGNGQVGRARNRITKDEYGDCVIVEHFSQPGGAANGGEYIGNSVSMYDTQSRKWRQMWVDNSGLSFILEGGPVTGKDYVFEMKTIGKIATTASGLTYGRMIWQNVTRNSLTWRWQRQQPDGSWVDTWNLRYKRRGAAAD